VQAQNKGILNYSLMFILLKVGATGLYDEPVLLTGIVNPLNINP